MRIAPIANIEELQTACSSAVRAGFDGVEWPVSGEPVDGRSTELASRAGLFTDSVPPDLSVIAMAVKGDSTNLGGTVERVTALLRDGEQLGARCLNYTIPPIRSVSAEIGFVSYSDALNFAYHLLRRVRFEAEATGVAVALEAATGRTLLSPVELRELVDAANSWAVGVCVDVAYASVVGSPADWIEVLGPRVHSLRVSPGSPSRPKDDDSRATEFNALLTALRRVPAERPIIAAGSDDARGQRAFLADLGCPIEVE